ncbi:hypothetical protein [Paenisporosarcina sp. TG20]|uniref:hypothetical protein n=1 Tax=Paenisporosarcina sp. TG20 TaxID=1211706 RepID=UPI0002D2CEEC|nr:hypothetical protein [Paenisporosarcina sp. TG20]
MDEEYLHQLVNTLQGIQQELRRIGDSLHTLAHNPPEKDKNFLGLEEKLRVIGCFLEDISYRK